MVDRVSPLPESTFESVQNVQASLSYLVMIGQLILNQEEGFDSYTPTGSNTLVITRVISKSDDEDEAYQEELVGVSGIGYSSDPTPDSKLLVGHTNTEPVLSWLTTRGITKLEIK